MNDKNENQELSADTLKDLALSAVKHVPLSSDELRELAAPVAEATDETAVPPTSPFDIDAIRKRVAYIEAEARKGRHLPDVELPCMNAACKHGNKILVHTVRQVDDWVRGRNLCDGCAADRFMALPSDKQDAITALNDKATDILYAGSWVRLTDAEYEQKLRQAQRFWDEARLLEDAWIYDLNPQDAQLPPDGRPVVGDIEDDLPF